MKELDQAKKALADGEEPRALELLVEGWRNSRATKIATLAESLSKRFEPHLGPIAGKLETFQPRWLAIANQQRAIDLPRLLGSVLHTTDRFGTAVVDALVARGEVLSRWPIDPRASTLIVDHLLAGGYESTSKSTHPFWLEMFVMLARNADPRIGPRLAKIQFAKVFKTFSDGARRIAWFQEQLDRVRATTSGVSERKLSKAVDERAAAIAKLIAQRKKLSPETIAAIAQDPVVPAKAPKRAATAPKLDTRAARPHVDTALRSIQSGDDGAALRSLLEAWRTTRASQIADLVDAVSRRCESRLPPIAESTRDATQKTWLAICREGRAEDLPRLLASITNTFFRSTDALERVNALASWPSDPRTLAGVIGALERPPFHASSTKPFWSALIALCVDHQDPRAADALEKLAGRYHGVITGGRLGVKSVVTWFENQLTDAAGQLRERVPAPLSLDSSTVEACTKIAAIVETEDQLLREIYEHLDDDRARVVYADVLQQRGDPRGEMIALQLANRASARAYELVHANARQWLGPLLPLVQLQYCTFKRGFLDEVYCKNIEASDLDPVIGHPLWSTVTKLGLNEMQEWPQAFLDHEVMRRLTTVTITVGGVLIPIERDAEGRFVFHRRR